jgi:hypothetical protein
MATEKKKKKTHSARADAFASVAFWQLMAFIMLLCFVWASEVLDLPALLFGLERTPFNLFRACLMSAAVIVAAVIAVGHTYEQQKALMKNLLTACLYCHRVKTKEDEWVHIEDYFLKLFPVALDRGACPECDQMLKSVSGRAKDVQKEAGDG